MLYMVKELSLSIPLINLRVSNANSSQPSGGPVPPNGSGADMPGGGPLTPLQQGNTTDSNLNAPKFTGNRIK